MEDGGAVGTPPVNDDAWWLGFLTTAAEAFLG